MKNLPLLITLIFGINTLTLADTNPHYKLTAGMGTGVCEAYLKHLNALPANESPPTCGVKLSPKYQDIKLPKFELLDWKEHLELIYQLEKFLYISSEENYKNLSFDEWKQVYLGRIKSGEFRPQLRRGKAVLNEMGSEVVIDYDRRVGDCDKNSKYGGYSGSRYFVLIDGQDSKVDLIESLRTHMIIFRGRAFFMSHRDPYQWGGEIYKVNPSWSGKDPNERRYVLDTERDICQYRLTK